MPQSSNNPFHIGLRTFKTAVSVFICVVLFRILHRGSPMLAALSAIFSLRIDHQQTFKFALSRCIGNTTGGVVAIILFYVRAVLPFIGALIAIGVNHLLPNPHLKEQQS